jgi:hypothetical protein
MPKQKAALPFLVLAPQPRRLACDFYIAAVEICCSFHQKSRTAATRVNFSATWMCCMAPETLGCSQRKGKFDPGEIYMCTRDIPEKKPLATILVRDCRKRLDTQLGFMSIVLKIILWSESFVG